MRILNILIVTCLFISSLKAQTNVNVNVIDKAYEEIEKRGITENELKDALEKRGIDLDELKSLQPEELIKYQREVEGVVKELELEKIRLKNAKAKIPSAIDVRDNNARQFVNKDSILSRKDFDSVLVLRKNRDSLSLRYNDTIPKVEIWGQHLFKNKYLPLYESAKDIKAPSNYVLGVGDKISVAIWGASQYNEQFEINAEGYITPARMPRIFLKGITLGRAKGMLNSYFRRFYRFDSNQFEANLISSRTILVHIVGEVEQYGSFTLPAMNSVFNALVAAGGPNKIGSVRKVKLIRNGKDRTLDIYKFILNPASMGDISIENNDYIQIPVAGRVVEIKGAVNRPFKYELLDGEELKSLIFFAAGLKVDALTKTMQIERLEGDKRIILDVPFQELTASGGDFKLKKGDIVSVLTIKTKTEDFVYVKGEVRAESAYNLKEGMTLNDLIKKLDFTVESDLNNAFLVRHHPDNTSNIIRVSIINVRKGLDDAKIILNPKDELLIYKRSDYIDKSYVAISGAVRNSGRYPFNVNKDMRIKDLVMYSGGLKPNSWQNAYLFRSKNSDHSDQIVIKISIKDVFNEETSDKNIYLEPYDSIVILSENQFSESSYLEISGAVKSPGKMQFSKSLTLKDVITFAGGFTISAAANKIDIYRIQIISSQPTKTIVKSFEVNKDLLVEDASSSFELEPFDYIVVRTQPNFELQRVVYIEGEVLYPGPYAILGNNEKVMDIINRAGGLTHEAFPEGATLNRINDNVGYIVLDLPDAIKNFHSRNNILVKDKDVLTIPKRKDFVRISGETNVADLYPDKLIASNNSINVPYYEGRRADYYIKNFAAGVNRNGDRNRITVEHSNGRVESTRRSLFGRVYPKVYKGSIINVGAKIAKDVARKKERKDIDWSKVVADSIAQATGVLSLILLIQRLD